MPHWLRYHWLGLIVATVLGVLAWNQARQLRLEQNIETMFAEDDPLVPAWRLFKSLFGSQEVLLAAYAEPDGLNAKTWPRLEKLTAELQAAVPGLKVQSLSSQPLGAGILADHALAQAMRQLLTDYLISADQKTIAIVCVLPSHTSSELSAGEFRAQVIAKLQQVIQQYPNGTLAGEPVMLVEGFRMLELDGERLERVSLVLIMLTLLLSFRSLRWVVIPLVLVLLTIWCTRAILALSGYRLTMVSSMLSAMLTIVCVATVVHLIVRYQAELRRGHTPVVALTLAAKALFWPICGAIATDMIGFGSLILSRVGPVHDFGIMTMLGCALVIPLGVLIIPGLILIGQRSTTTSTSQKDIVTTTKLGHWLGNCWQHLAARPMRSLAVVGLITVLSLIGISRIKIETDFTQNFRSDSPLVTAYDFVETRLGGAGVWEILLPVPEQMSVADWQRLRRLEKKLRSLQVPSESAANQTQPALTKVLSLVDVLDAMTVGKLVDQAESFLTRATLTSALTLLQQQQPELLSALQATQNTAQGPQRWLRIMLRAKERMSAESKTQIIQQVRDTIATEWPTTTSTEEAAAPKLTGFYVLLSSLIQSLQQDQWLTAVVAAVLIWLLLSLCLRSPMLGLIGLIPNLLSIVVMLGMVGWSGVRANMGTVMIAAVSMGLAVDSSIHFLVAYRQLRRTGKSVTQALIQVQQGTGPALVWATLSLIIGFTSLCNSQFVPTIHFGLYSSLAMLGGMLENLIVLPLLLTLWEQEVTN